MTYDLVVATVNDDWQTPHRTNLPEVAPHVDLILAQECKYVSGVPLPKTFAWHHNTSDLSKAGCAVWWRRSVLRKSGGGGIFLGVHHGTAKMLNRWCVWNRFVMRAQADKRLLAIAAHRPPLRYKWLWAAFDLALAAWVKHHHKRGWEVLIGMDANSHDPQPLQRLLPGFTWHHYGIDGFLVSPGLHVGRVHTLAKGSSDHHPVLAEISFRGSR